jgi:GNAT superfamily N-acetyltransferase
MSIRIRLPKKYSFKVVKYHDYWDGDKISIRLLYGKNHTRVGYVDLMADFYGRGHRSLETHSYLDPKHRGKKLGALMYAKAIQWCHENNRPVRSSGSSSEDAQRVWKGKTLRKFFNIRKSYNSAWARRNKDDYEATWKAYRKP